MNVLKKVRTRLRPTPQQIQFREDLIMRDYLALDRTRLANERSLLAYYRTGLTTLVSGVSGFSLFHEIWLRSVAMMFIVLGIGLMLLGILRYYRFRRRLVILGRPDYSKVKP